MSAMYIGPNVLIWSDQLNKKHRSSALMAFSVGYQLVIGRIPACTGTNAKRVFMMPLAWVLRLSMRLDIYMLWLYYWDWVATKTPNNKEHGNFPKYLILSHSVCICIVAWNSKLISNILFAFYVKSQIHNYIIVERLENEQPTLFHEFESALCWLRLIWSCFISGPH